MRSDIGIPGKTSHLLGLAKLLLKSISLLDVLGKLGVPALDIIIVKAWWIINATHSLGCIFGTIVFAGTPCLLHRTRSIRIKWVLVEVVP